MKTIIIFCEVNDQDDVLVAQVMPLAKVFGSQLYLIHVAAPEPDFIGYEPGPQHERDWRAGVLHNEHRLLQERAVALRELGIDTTALLLQGETVPMILTEAKRLNADLLVVGNHHHGIFHRVLSGSVSDGLTQQVDCPLLLVPIKS